MCEDPVYIKKTFFSLKNTQTIWGGVVSQLGGSLRILGGGV